MDGGTQRIACDFPIPFGPHRLPDQRGDEVGHPDPAGPFAHPAEHVAVGRAVGELAAVRAVLTQGEQVRVGALRVAGPGRAPAHGTLHHPDLGVQRGVGLAERHSGPHVEQVADGGPGVARGPGLRHVGRDRGGGVELPAVGQDPGHAAHQRLRHRHEQVRGGGGHALVVPFGHQVPVVQHDQRVGVGVREHLRGRRGAAVDPPDRRVGQRPGEAAGSGARSVPAGIGWLGMSSRMCRKAHRLNGGSCQLSSVTRASGAGGKPVMSPVPSEARARARRPGPAVVGHDAQTNRTRARPSVI